MGSYTAQGTLATLSGEEQNDGVFSMGDGSSLAGGNGDDLLKVVRDVLHRADISEGLGMNAARTALVGFEKGQSVPLGGGDGNDALISEVKLRNARASGGSGDDVFELGTLVKSALDAGTGSDFISVDVASSSTLKGGEGDDAFFVGTEFPLPEESTNSTKRLCAMRKKRCAPVLFPGMPPQEHFGKGILVTVSQIRRTLFQPGGCVNDSICLLLPVPES